MTSLLLVPIMLKRTGTKQRSDDRTRTNLSRLITVYSIICESICLAGCGAWQKCVVGKPVNPKCGNRHDNIDPASFYYCVNTK